MMSLEKLRALALIGSRWMLIPKKWIPDECIGNTIEDPDVECVDTTQLVGAMAAKGYATLEQLDVPENMIPKGMIGTYVLYQTPKQEAKLREDLIEPDFEVFPEPNFGIYHLSKEGEMIME